MIFAARTFSEIQEQVEIYGQLSQTNKQYWARLGEILGKPKKSTLSTGGKKINSLDYPVDKLNLKMWGLFEEDTKGQIKIKAEKKGSKKPINILYAINFDDLPITTSKRLTPFDKRVYTIIAALYKAGNRIITCTQIHQAMGFTTRPAKSQVEKIRNSVLKMSGAKVFIDNKEEVDTGYNYPRVIIDGPLLPLFHRHDCVINGQQVQEAFAPICAPPIIEFARGRNQIEEVPKKALETPVSKTDKNMAIEDYLIERILRAKRSSDGRKILLSTLFKYAKIDDARSQKRALKDVQDIMQHYFTVGLVSSFNLSADAITFTPQVDKMSLVGKTSELLAKN